MWDILYPIASVFIGSMVVFLAGFTAGAVFLWKSRTWAPWMKAHPRVLRLIAAGFVMLGFFLAVKFLAPLYKGLIAGTGVFLFVWGFLSRVAKRIIWKEVLTLSFWVPESGSRIAKNGT